MREQDNKAMEDKLRELIEAEMSAYYDGEYMDHSIVKERLHEFADSVAKLLQSPAAATPAQPDWTNSETLPSELWKNPLIPMHERLEIADGAINFRDKVIANLRSQLAAAPSQSDTPALEREAQQPVAWVNKRCIQNIEWNSAFDLPNGAPLFAGSIPAAQHPALDEREEFEKWLNPSWSKARLTDDEGDEIYVEEWVQGAWIAWQARAASPSPDAADAEELKRELTLARLGESAGQVGQMHLASLVDELRPNSERYQFIREENGSLAICEYVGGDVYGYWKPVDPAKADERVDAAMRQSDKGGA